MKAGNCNYVGFNAFLTHMPGAIIITVCKFTVFAFSSFYRKEIEA